MLNIINVYIHVFLGKKSWNRVEIRKQKQLTKQKKGQHSLCVLEDSYRVNMSYKLF